MAHVLAFVNQKGGVAKTTSTVNLGAALRERGKRVLAPHQQAIGRELEAARMGNAEAGDITLMRSLEHQRPVLLVQRGLHIGRPDQLGI